MSLVKLAMKLVGKTGKSPAIHVLANLMNDIANSPQNKNNALRMMAKTRNAGRNKEIMNKIKKLNINTKIEKALKSRTEKRLTYGGKAIADELL